MNLDWQLVIVAACVAWAVVATLFRCYRVVLGNPSSPCGSGGCHDCPSNADPSSSGLVQLEMPLRDSTKSPK